MENNMHKINNSIKDQARLKGINSLHFNALTNNQKNKKQDSLNLINSEKSMIIPTGLKPPIRNSDPPKRPTDLDLSRVTKLGQQLPSLVPLNPNVKNDSGYNTSSPASTKKFPFEIGENSQYSTYSGSFVPLKSNKKGQIFHISTNQRPILLSSPPGGKNGHYSPQISPLNSVGLPTISPISPTTPKSPKNATKSGNFPPQSPNNGGQKGGSTNPSSPPGEGGTNFPNLNNKSSKSNDLKSSNFISGGSRKSPIGGNVAESPPSVSTPHGGSKILGSGGQIFDFNHQPNKTESKSHRVNNNSGFGGVRRPPFGGNIPEGLLSVSPPSGGSPVWGEGGKAGLNFDSGVKQSRFGLGTGSLGCGGVRAFPTGGGVPLGSPSHGEGAHASPSRVSSSDGSQMSRVQSDEVSVRSLASIGMGSTDGKRMVIRRVPQSPEQLLNFVNPPTPQDEYDFDCDSYGVGSEDHDSLYLKPRRQHWANKMQFVLACVGYSVGLGNIWRFPYLCYKSGGGVFLIPYFLIMFFCGIPMLYMELAVGQFTGRGPIGALAQICPLFKGAGLASVVISFLMSTYYSVIIAYGIYYFFTSFKVNMPWNHCGNRWNTNHCWDPRYSSNFTRMNNSRTASEEFFDNKVLQISSGIEDPGSLRWDLVACLLCAWILVYFAIWKSIKSSAKVRYFTATLPFLLIVVFLARSLSLEGADKGMRYFFKPKWELLKSANVWVNAAAQNFNSFGVAFGSMINFASYNKYNNNILHDTLAVSFVNAVTSLLVGIFSFAVIGNIATELNTPNIEDVISDGPGLIFVVYPQAIAKMPASQFWAVLFFFMLLCLGLNSQFAIVEVVVTSIQDGFPGWIKKKLVCHELLVLLVCSVSFLFGLPHVTKGGIYFFQLVDHYAASISIMYLAFFEVIAIAWFYGVYRLSKNIENMNAKTPSMYFKFCWMIAAPLLIMAVWIFCMIDYKTPTYQNGAYQYPIWAIVLGWFISSLSISCIPLFALYVFLKAEGENWKEKLRNSLMPDLYECKICGDHNCEHMEEEQEMQEISPMLILKLESQISTSDTQSRVDDRQNGTYDPKL